MTLPVMLTTAIAIGQDTVPGLDTRNFYFQDRNNLKFQDIFQDIRVTKNAFFCHFGHV